MEKIAHEWVGQPLTRNEDSFLLRGEGKYLDDINVEGQLHMRVVRSPFARAVIKSIDTSRAAQMSGVAAVYSAKDFAPMFTVVPPAAAPGVKVSNVAMSIIADRNVNYVGEPVAVVLAASRELAEDAADGVDIDYEQLPCVTDPRSSLFGGMAIHEGISNNVLISWEKKSDDFDEALSRATSIVEGTFELPRLVASPMEPRGCLVSYDTSTDAIMLWASSQDPHRPRAQLAQVFDLPADHVRVVIPEVGGAFGSKGGAPQEYILACASSKKLGHPVKWVEDRSENFLSSYQGRGISARVRLGLDDGGLFLALEAELLADLGAYLFQSTPIAPYTAATMMTGAYRIPSVKISLTGVATNKVPTGPYRGAGRPEACFFVERIVDMAANKVGLDHLEIRLRNLIPPDSFPYVTPLGLTYDSGNYEPVLKRASELLGVAKGANGCENSDGWLSATGIAMSVEPAGAGLWESGSIEVLGTGTVIAKSGSSSHGQGHKTAFAQIVADELGVDIESVSIMQGDSDFSDGVGTFGSRSILLGGEALVVASREVRDLALDWASSFFEVAKEDLVWDTGRVHVQGSPQSQLTLFEIARQMESSEKHLTLAAKTRSNIPGPVFPFGAYGAEVEIDLATGFVRLRRIIAVDDTGTIINPLLAEGQVTGATLQGIASALWEEMIYDEDGLPLTGSFLDYLIPSSAESDFRSTNEFRCTPTPFTSLGAKGIAESGTVGALAAVANAVNAALARLGFTGHLDPPYSPEKMWNTLVNLGKVQAGSNLRK